MEIKITNKTTVKVLKDQFHNEYEGTLRVYDGKSEAADDVLLVLIGAKEGIYECRGSKTVRGFCEDMLKEFNLKVKVATSDNWVIVLDNITLATIKDIPKQCTKAQMDEFVAYKRTDNKKLIDIEALKEVKEKLNSFSNDYFDYAETFFAKVPEGTVIYSCYYDSEDDRDEEGRYKAEPLPVIRAGKENQYDFANGLKFLVKDGCLIVIEACSTKSWSETEETYFYADLKFMQNTYLLYRLLECLEAGYYVPEEEADSIKFFLA